MKSELLFKLGLGTAQWGLDYGVSNNSGITTPEEVSHILKFAKDSGIRVIDTAQAYGQAEHILGRNDLSDFKLITKIPALNYSHNTQKSLEEWLDLKFARSLSSIGTDTVQGVLLHNCDDLFSQYGSKIVRFLFKLKKNGRCRQIGVSVYNSHQVKKILNLFTPDIIQLPFSIFDQRFLSDGTLDKLKDLDIEIHARSIFLQGLLLMKIENIPSYFKPWMPDLIKWRRICKDLGSSPQHVALGYVILNDYIDHVIVGVESLSQLIDLSSAPCKNDISLFDALSLSDPEILNPSLWNL